MKFAVIETGGKQYNVSPDKKLKIEKLNAKEGDKLVFDKVLLMVDGEDIKIGTPYVEGAKVEVQLLKQGRDKKKIIFRYHSKTRYRKKKGHRQPFSEIKVSNSI